MLVEAAGSESATGAGSDFDAETLRAVFVFDFLAAGGLAKSVQ